jgi:AcrR family transcriptional regulator
MADVAAAAGLSEGTLYNYFQDKTDLVVSVGLAALKRNVDEAERIAATAVGLEQGLRDLIAHQLRSMLAAPEMYRIWLREVKAADAYSGSDARDALRSFSGQFVAFLDRWTPTHNANGLDRTAMRDMLYGGIEQVGWTAIIQNRRRTFDIDGAALKLASAYLAAFGLKRECTVRKSPRPKSAPKTLKVEPNL